MSVFRNFTSEHGIGKLTLLVFGSIIAAGLYYGFHVLPFYYSYYEIQNQMDSAIRVAQMYDDNELRRKLVYHIKKQGIPVNPDKDLHIMRGEHKMTIWMNYTEVFYITWKGQDYILQTFDFEARAEGFF